MPTEPKKPLIVISYAHADEPEQPAEGEVKWLSFVTGYLRPAIKHGAVDLWLDRLISGGGEWEREIEQKLHICDIFLLLVSRHSLSSDYVVDKEIKIIRERQAKGEAVHFYPLVLTPTPKIALAHIRDYNLRPKDGRPLSDFPLNERYRQMVIVADEVEELITTATSSETQMQTETPKELLTGGRQGPKSVEDSISQPRGKRADGDLNDAPVDHDSRRWRRIQITMSGTRRDPRLSFTVSSGPKLVEASTIAANLELTAPLMRRASRIASNDVGRALFELLWPAALKDEQPDERPVLLILDQVSAGFPWELLDDRRPWISESEQEPLALRVGIVRQIFQARARESAIALRVKRKALIVGNPRGAPTEMPDLPGAEEEAKAIAASLQDTYEVTLLTGKEAGPVEISRLLFTNAWDVIHISGHGVTEMLLPGPDGGKRKRTGIVLGGGVVLGPSALSKLPVSPDVFFVNCSNLGVGSMDKFGRQNISDNVAIELLRLGTRCVIAAGWAVDDEAAIAFAKRFYMGLVWGETFGVATLRARREAHASKPESNTWAAYQCYGDPDYRLSPVASDLIES